MGTYTCCLCFTRRFRSAEVQPPADVRAAFEAHTEGATHMNADQLRRFLNEAQGEATPDDADRIIEQTIQLRPRQPFLAILSKPALTVEDFYNYLFSEDLNPPVRSQVHQDMTAPLSHYYIYTGHNSYLTGNQLSSDCSDVPIIKALQDGVRVIELDMWPNSTKDDIDILHGRTLTSPVELIKCLRSIKEYAFTASPYPVIITLEDHLTPDLQAKVAQMVVETFGDMLYYPESESSNEFPSPEALKERIIISTKPPKEYLEAKNDKENNCDTQDVNESDDEAWGKEVPDVQTELESADKTGEDNSDDGDDSDDDDQKVNQSSPPEYKSLITIRAGKPKGDLSDALKVDPDKLRRLSLSEKELAKAAASHGLDLVRFTQRNLLRIYPKGTRVNSSNYNPFVGWIHGAQMVAFNMQGYGRSLWLMHGFYKVNGGCGYVKKPEFLLKNEPNDGNFDPKAKFPVKKTLKVKVYMGDGWRVDFNQTHFDSYSPPDFYTRLGIAGVPSDTTMKKTKAIEDNWIPVWDEEFIFPLTVPELALLRIEVHEHDKSGKDDFAGQTCLPVSELRQGFRSVPLFDRKGMKFKSVRLLMRFEFE
ncbi:phosphoinositide phospholipase C 6-like [Zingiber officinale]|uniref:phosphoinositide phospholipase C 6-like n=1 Tax=Zingiber officinale TaxID=94328 RepID=UPI001C4BC1C9|nr:phosphoinositide phospholipase C 6-like [Zingiber officinale]